MVSNDLIAVARGDRTADVVLTNARIVNVMSGEILEGCVALAGESIACAGGDHVVGMETIDLEGAYLMPGFIDAHMHVESTLLPPSEFVRLATPHGTTGVVLDPHEIANVLGIAGIRFVMENARGLPINAMFALSSCVPASHLETSGARLEAADLAPLFDDDRVVALAEMMNFPGIVTGRAELLAKVELGLSRRGVVDGHAPGLRGRALQAYCAAGISSDHECTTSDEAIEKVRAGMTVHIREGSAARNLEALLPAVNPHNAHRFCFCTDDRHPADLRAEGHIDHVVRRAIDLGLDPITAIRMATINPARHYRRRDLGAIAPGFKADLVVCDDLNDLQPTLVMHHGRVVARDGAYVHEACSPSGGSIPRSPLRLPERLSVDSFKILTRGPGQVRVIGMDPHQLTTASLSAHAKIEAGCCVSDPARDILKLAVVERHKGTGNVGLGFVKGFGLAAGAMASTVGHDSHNLAIVGTNDADMLAAARALEACGGGQCAVRDGRVLAILPLPIAGLMSDQSAETVIAQQAALLEAAKSMGCPHHDPFMPLSFLPLPVIPHLKLTDLGLVDVDRFEIVPLWL
ncbi:MAG: adenine deaminase [Phycisphaerales bacterium]|nr:adenine deaminase [Phycisphaerales bacterium]